ncbi:electron transport complex subunit RsxC [Pelovirga terrestris]|uniref:Ion-translocating oxidoreductase complex subunit C n=1 Tax=Pelovirga terrestris TaxID=2771352 RepID=A0A8J6QMB6_9BACT|nr:electron transport complex subunit RsxC [Pelovirga terrestris]MBD1399952.1 electron transport complex subunit RsxC [Pelovirga terrestris]
MKLPTFPGGIHPPDNKATTAGKAIVNCPLPNELIVPMLQHIGAPAECCVTVGQQVAKGEQIGTAVGPVSVPIHAPTSGEVIAIEPRLHPVGRPLPAVVIRPDGDERWHEGLQACDPDSLNPDELRQLLRQAGIVGLGGATFPTHIKLSPPPDRRIDTLIINGVECEPYLTGDHRLMLEEGSTIVDGILILRKILGVDRVILAIENNKSDAIAVMRQLCTATPIQVQPLPVKYPQGAEKQLIEAVTGRQVPSGKLPMDCGAVVQNVGTAAAVNTAVHLGRPLVERITTVTGTGVRSPKNLRVAIGTPLTHLIEQCGGFSDDPGKIILGGPMMGNSQISLEVPVIRGTSGLLVLRQQDISVKKPGPCIRCGQCVKVCPIHLQPTVIALCARLGLVEKADSHNALDCIECGCCTYQCPATLPLVQSIREIKGAIMEHKRKH